MLHSVIYTRDADGSFFVNRADFHSPRSKVTHSCRGAAQIVGNILLSSVVTLRLQTASADIRELEIYRSNLARGVFSLHEGMEKAMLS